MSTGRPTWHDLANHAAVARTQQRAGRRRGRVEIGIGPVEYGCDFRTWAADARYERCTLHGEVRKRGNDE